MTNPGQLLEEPPVVGQLQRGEQAIASRLASPGAVLVPRWIELIVRLRSWSRCVRIALQIQLIVHKQPAAKP